MIGAPSPGRECAHSSRARAAGRRAGNTHDRCGLSVDFLALGLRLQPLARSACLWHGFEGKGAPRGAPGVCCRRVAVLGRSHIDKSDVVVSDQRDQPSLGCPHWTRGALRRDARHICARGAERFALAACLAVGLLSQDFPCWDDGRCCRVGRSCWSDDAKGLADGACCRRAIEARV